ncbi:hypothetical protein ACFSHR_01060 [Azotobacter chroococcum]
MYLITESALNPNAPYDPTLLAFFHQGVEIRNPYLSPAAATRWILLLSTASRKSGPAVTAGRWT